jgi:hypothetical protein
METRALAIAFFYAVGTATGGIAGPLLFGELIHSGNIEQVATGFFIGAAVMAVGGIAELLFGVRAEQQSLENIARPLTAEEADASEPPPAPETPQRVRDRAARRRVGARRVRPGYGSTLYSPGMLGTAGTSSRHTAISELELEREIEALVRALDEHGKLRRRALRRILVAEAWGPGRFGRALREAVRDGRATRGAGGTYDGSRRERARGVGRPAPE